MNRQYKDFYDQHQSAVDAILAWLNVNLGPKSHDAINAGVFYGLADVTLLHLILRMMVEGKLLKISTATDALTTNERLTFQATNEGLARAQGSGN